MSSIALKFTSLAIRTLSKPIANYIKKQAREHPGFRTTCINFAQSIHRVDMRWRIGLLQDSAALERQARKDAQREADKKAKSSVTTVKTEAQSKTDEDAATKAADDATADAEKHKPKPKIRPLSEAKAIETGANFISETFLFSVAAGLILFESWRSRRKESNRRDVIADRLNDLEESESAARRALIELEREVLQLRAKEAKDTAPTQQQRILPREVYDPPQDDKSDEVGRGWLSRIAAYISSKEVPDEEAKQALATASPGPAEKILQDSDKALDEKHKLQAAEAAAGEEEEGRNVGARKASTLR